METLKEIAKNMPDEIMDYVKYKELADKLEDSEDREKMMKIAEQEKQHYEMLKDMLESYM